MKIILKRFILKLINRFILKPIILILSNSDMLLMFAASIALFIGLATNCQADRIIALDVVFASTITLTIAAALVSGRVLYLDIAVGLALVGFVAAIVWSRLIDAGTRSSAAAPDEKEDVP